jgi:hypothetical protein
MADVPEPEELLLLELEELLLEVEAGVAKPDPHPVSRLLAARTQAIA